MKHYMTILVCFLCVGAASIYGWDEPMPTTRSDIVRWFEEGIKQEATHLLVVCDRFDYFDFPAYVYSGEQPQEKIDDWNSQEFYRVMEVYALHLDMDTQISERRSWHLESAF